MWLFFIDLMVSGRHIVFDMSICLSIVGGVFGKGNIYTTADVVGFHRPNDNWGRHIVSICWRCVWEGKYLYKCRCGCFS
jgi:hypothetical protein